MNKVTKSDKVPDILIDKGTREIALLRENVAENKPLVFKDQIYADDEVKKQLKSDQFGKCAYCERSLNGDFGAVEHFRPKGGYQIEDEKSIATHINNALRKELEGESVVAKFAIPQKYGKPSANPARRVCHKSK